jgi:osmotically-inducible protein OsmY
MRRLRRLLPFSTFSGAAWFALRHRRPLWDWGQWTVRSVPRLVAGDGPDLYTEARLRARLHSDERLLGDDVDVTVSEGRARLWGEVGRGHRAVATELAESVAGVERVDDELRERRRSRRGR